MARSQKAKPNEDKVAAYVARLVAAKTDRLAFDAISAEIAEGKDLSAADLVAIAHAYNKGGKKPASKAKALETIRKRFVEIVRTANKNKIAEKARPW